MSRKAPNPGPPKGVKKPKPPPAPPRKKLSRKMFNADVYINEVYESKLPKPGRWFFLDRDPKRYR